MLPVRLGQPGPTAGIDVRVPTLLACMLTIMMALSLVRILPICPLTVRRVIYRRLELTANRMEAFRMGLCLCLELAGTRWLLTLSLKTPRLLRLCSLVLRLHLSLLLVLLLLCMQLTMPVVNLLEGQQCPAACRLKTFCRLSDEIVL